MANGAHLCGERGTRVQGRELVSQGFLCVLKRGIVLTPFPIRRLYFLLCIYGYESLRRPFRVSEAIGISLLSMTLRDDADISADEARRLLLALKSRGLGSISGEVRATFMADLELAMSDPEAARVENLAGSFEDSTYMLARDAPPPPPHMARDSRSEKRWLTRAGTVALFREFVNNHSGNEVAMSE